MNRNSLPRFSVAIFYILIGLGSIGISAVARAVDPPGVLNHQGRITENGVNYHGAGFFKFSLVKDVGVGTEAILWHHDGTGTGTAEPAGEVGVTVTKGHYAVLLGDAPMTEIPANVFTDNDHVSLRIWFSKTSGSGFEHLSPDRRVTSVGYALSASSAAMAVSATTASSVSGAGVDISGGNLTLPATTATTGILFSGTNTMLHSFGSNSFFAGEGAGNLTHTAFGLTGVGKGALKSNTSGTRNSAFGRWALRENTTGENNNAIGHEALRDNTSGDENTATGRAAMFKNTTGSRNTATGQIALRDNTSGDDNTAIGRQAMLLNTTGSDNTAVGGDALGSNTTGEKNTAIGQLSMNANTSGKWNTAVGQNSLTANTTGEKNTAIGQGALPANTTGNENTALGQNALLTNTIGKENTGLGQAALAFNTEGSYNTAVGEGSLQNNTTGEMNTAVGEASLTKNTIGNSNTAVGEDALFANTEGSYNAAVGQLALGQNTIGERNTGIGRSALTANTEGSYNTALGMNTLFTNTTGAENTGVGQSSLAFNTIGSFNTAAGEDALLDNTEGNRNTAVGNNALENNTTGDDNIALGDVAGMNLTAGDDNIMIGNLGVAAESGTIRIGDGDQARAFVAGIRGVTTGVGDAITVMIDSNGQLGTMSSSRRYKEDIHDMDETETSRRVQQLRPVTFRYKGAFDDGSKPLQYGLIAEEVAAVFPDLAVFNEEGRPETVKYHLLTPLLLNEVQKLQVSNDELRAEKDEAFDALKTENAELRLRLEKLEAAIIGNRSE